MYGVSVWTGRSRGFGATESNQDFNPKISGWHSQRKCKATVERALMTEVSWTIKICCFLVPVLESDKVYRYFTFNNSSFILIFYQWKVSNGPETLDVIKDLEIKEYV